MKATEAELKPKTKLRGKDPKAAEPSKPKILIYGAPGVGKTWTSIEFPSGYYIDTEGGANRDHYTDKLKRSGGAYLGPEDGSLDPKMVLEEIQTLATEKHSYRTLILDSITKEFNTIASNESERLGDKDVFGASKKPAIAWMRRLLNWLNRIDMSVILIAHQKDEWGANGTGKVGETFDCWDKTAYELDLVLKIEKRGPSRVAVVKKSRLLGFPEGTDFPWSYEEFAKRYGRDVIESDVKTITLATAEQLEAITNLLDVVRMDESEISKWFTKAQVESWSEMSTETIQKCIEHLKSKVTVGV